MPIYWIIFFSPLVIRAIQFAAESNEMIESNKQKNEKVLVMLVFGIIVFFAGMRSKVGDTVTYIQSYRNLPSSIMEFDRRYYNKDWVFYFLSCCFKSITRGSYQPWLFLMALISGVAFARGVYKYSEYKWLTCYLFIAGAMFTYFFNGVRQFIVMGILFCNTDCILQRKYTKFIILVAIMSLIHGSAWTFLPIIFLERSKPWEKEMFGIIAISIVVAYSFNSFAEALDNVLAGTQYAGMGKVMADGTGSTYVRVIIAAIPVILSFTTKEMIERDDDKFVNFCVNCSVMHMCIMLISTFSYGIYMGRVAVYYEMYNLILLPTLLHRCFEKRTSAMLIAICIIMYFVYFYYQMVVVWGMFYSSNALGLYL